MKNIIKIKKNKLVLVFSFAILLLFFLFFVGKTPLQRILIMFLTGETLKEVTIPEGLNRFQIAKRLEKIGITKSDYFLAVTEDSKLLEKAGIKSSTAEGYLFPDTYYFYSGVSPFVIMKKMAGNFRKKFLNFDRKYPGWRKKYESISDNPEYAVLILASIVQKETSKKDEARIIAGIFLKRLTDNGFTPHVLQSDPTALYGCLVQVPPPPACTNYDGKLSILLRDRDNFYNTYIYPGLPPGPICNPGEVALDAAFNPASTPYFYFVAKGDGTHQFSSTLEEHKKAIETNRQ